MNAVLQTVWVENESTVAERVALICAAIERLIAGELDEDMRESALRAAHMLAGSLGLFDLHRAGEAAHALEAQLQRGGWPGPERTRILREELAELSQARARVA